MITTPEPTALTRQQYARVLERLQELVVAAMKLTMLLGGVPAEWRLVRASELFTRLTLMASTFTRVLPEVDEGGSSSDWDWASTAALGRAILEAYAMLVYVAFDQITAEEQGFRLLYLTYHQNSEKFRLYQDMSIPPEDLADFRKGLPNSRAKLEAHPFFQALSRDQQKRVLKARDPTYLPRDELLSRGCLPTSMTRPMYRLLSNKVHTTPFSFQDLDPSRGGGSESEAERHYMTMTAELVRRCLADGGTRMLQAFVATVEQTTDPDRPWCVAVFAREAGVDNGWE